MTITYIEHLHNGDLNSFNEHNFEFKVTMAGEKMGDKAIHFQPGLSKDLTNTWEELVNMDDAP